MGSLIDELPRREAAARAEAEQLRGQIAQLAERLAGVEEQLSRLVIAREVVAEVLEGATSAEVSPVAAASGQPSPASTSSSFGCGPASIERLTCSWRNNGCFYRRPGAVATLEVRVMAAEHHLPVHVDPRYSRQTGADILRSGLPDLPASLSYDMTLPVAYWKDGSCGAVLFLSFNVFGFATPTAIMGTYRHDSSGWSARAAWAITGWSDDPIRGGGSYEDFERSSIVVSGYSISPGPAQGYPGVVVIGHAAKEVAAIAVTQGDRETRQNMDSYFGAWIICCQKASPYRVTALDALGNILGSVDEEW